MVFKKCGLFKCLFEAVFIAFLQLDPYQEKQETVIFLLSSFLNGSAARPWSPFPMNVVAFLFLTRPAKLSGRFIDGAEEAMIFLDVFLQIAKLPPNRF